MKKNFFKKLSFVMALAMIISVIAPAAGAFAATGLRLNATKKVLFLGENNTYNFNPLGMSKGATQKWTSSKTSVATVNAKNGVVTAKAVGTTTITATITNAKKTVTKKLTAKVTVGDNMKSISIVAPTGVDTAKLDVATDYDFNRSFVTMSGSKTKTSNITVWSLDKEGATINTQGVFNAADAGEYTITARAFRSKAHYNAWVKAGSAADSSYIKATDSVKVTVVNSVKEVKQTTPNAFTVEFAGVVKAEDLTATTASVAQVLNGKDVVTGAEKIKSIKLDSTGKVATVELFGNFAASTTYKFAYADMSATFVSAAKDMKYIKGIVFDDFTVNTKEGDRSADLLDSVYAVNADGVRFLTGSDISSYLSFEVTSDQTKGSVNSSTKKAYIYTAGNSLTVKATFTSYLYNEETKKYETVTYTDSAVGVGVDSDVDTATMQYAVAKTQPTTIASAWTSGVTMAAGDAGYHIFTRYKKTTDLASAGYTYSVANNNTTFTYVSSDPAKLSIVGTTIYPISAGTVTVIVKNSDGSKVLGSFEVQIGAERVLAAATPDVPSFTVGNHATYAETKKVVISTVDTLGSSMAANEVTASVIDNAGLAVTLLNAQSNAGGKIEFTVNAANRAVGTYQVKVRLSDTKLDGSVVTRDIVVSVTVVDSRTNAAIQNYDVILIKSGDATFTEVTNADFTDLNANTTYEVVVFGLNSAGFRVTQLPTQYYTPQITFNGVTVTSGALGLHTPAAGFDAVTTSNSALVLASTGVYNVTALATAALENQGVNPAFPVRALNANLDVTSFSLTNSFKTDMSLRNAVVSATTYPTVKAAVVKAFDFSATLRDNIQTAGVANVVEVKGINGNVGIADLTNANVNKGSLYIDSVTVDLTFNNVTKRFTFKVGKEININ